MNKSQPSIANILAGLNVEVPKASILMIGLPEAELPDAGEVDAFETVSSPDDLPQTLRAEIGIVFAPLDYMQHETAEHLLSRLRDVHCEKVLLVDTDSGWSPGVLRSLGYLELAVPSTEARCYLFDPDTFNQPREWNNPSEWANPENFRKYRW